MNPIPGDAGISGLVDEQIARNRTFTVVVAVAAVLNASLVAFVVAGMGGPVAALVCLLIMVGTIGAAWFFAEQLIPGRLGARPVQEKDFPQLLATVQRMSGQLRIPTPTVYVSDDDALNAGAFGTGDKAFVVYTTGLLAELDERELAAVTANELAHVVNRDTRLSGVTRNLLGWAIVICGAVTVLAVLIVGLGAAVVEGDDSGFGWVVVLSRWRRGHLASRQRGVDGRRDSDPYHRRPDRPLPRPREDRARSRAEAGRGASEVSDDHVRSAGPALVARPDRHPPQHRPPDRNATVAGAGR